MTQGRRDHSIIGDEDNEYYQKILEQLGKFKFVSSIEKFRGVVNNHDHNQQWTFKELVSFESSFDQISNRIMEVALSFYAPSLLTYGRDGSVRFSTEGI